ncbi:MAG: hypothetical protein WBP02_09085 [Gammaproteobacteria bacterium]
MKYQIISSLLTFCLLLTTHTSAVSFTADAIQMRGDVVDQAKMFWKNGSVRFEFLDQGVPMVQIFDNKNRKVIWLDTENKVFMQRELNEQLVAPAEINSAEQYNPCDNFAEAECNLLKATQYNGRATDKWLLTFNVDGKDHHVFQWIDQKHRILVRQENPDGSVLDVKILDDQEVNGRQVRKVDMIAISPDGSSVHGIQWYDNELNIVVRQQVDDGSIDELRNIKVEDVSPVLFAIPEGYKSVESQLSDLNEKPDFSFGTTDK